MKRKKRAAPPAGGQNERIHIDIEKKEEHNEYYRKVSSGYKAMKFLSVAALLVYLIVMMCIYRSEITYDNLMYLVKDLDTDVSVSLSGFEDISYEESGSISFGIFKNKLAVASNTGFTLFNTAGSSELESDCTMENPVVLTSDKYTMVYDLGGTEYSMYTAIARVLDKNSEYEIQGAALSDSGSFALITRSRENRYLVDFFNGNFKEVTRLYKDKYVMDVALDGKGRSYAVVSTDVKDSDFICEVMIGKTESEDSFTTELTGALPLSVSALSDGSFAVVCDSGVYFFSSEGEKLGEYAISGMTLRYADAADDKLLIAGGENLVGSTGRAVLLDSSASELYKSSFDGKINFAALGENSMFILSDGELSKISFDGTAEKTEADANVKALVPYSDNVVVCGENSARMGFRINP